MIIGDFVTAKERVNKIRISKKVMQKIESISYCMALMGLWVLALSICAHIK